LGLKIEKTKKMNKPGNIKYPMPVTGNQWRFGQAGERSITTKNSNSYE
jgi:hypothetical protein